MTQVIWFYFIYFNKALKEVKLNLPSEEISRAPSGTSIDRFLYKKHRIARDRYCPFNDYFETERSSHDVTCGGGKNLLPEKSRRGRNFRAEALLWGGMQLLHGKNNIK